MVLWNIKITQQKFKAQKKCNFVKTTGRNRRNLKAFSMQSRENLHVTRKAVFHAFSKENKRYKGSRLSIFFHMHGGNTARFSFFAIL